MAKAQNTQAIADLSVKELVAICKGDIRFNRKMQKADLVTLATELQANSTPTKAKAEKTADKAAQAAQAADKPSAANAPKDHLYCAVCGTHQPKKTMDATSTQGEGMCKDATACENRKKAAIKGKARTATGKARAKATTKRGDYSAKVDKIHAYRAGTKMQQMVDQLRTAEGATLEALAELIDTKVINVKHRVTYMMPRAGYNVVQDATDPKIFRITN